jgi:hypothetical protein
MLVRGASEKTPRFYRVSRTPPGRHAASSLAAPRDRRQAVVRGIKAGTNHKDLTLCDLQRLANALSLDLRQLLVSAGQETMAGQATLGDHRNYAVTQAGAVLYEIDRVTPVESLARTLCHTLDQTHDVLDELDRRLRPIGFRVHRLGNSALVRAPSTRCPARC